MAFTFEARTLLELGKELISNDDIALYELIKNAVDAGSPTVEILVRSRLPYTDYHEALRQVRSSDITLSEVTTFLRSKMTSPQDKRCDAVLAALNRTVDRTAYEKVLDYHYGMLNTIVIRDKGEGMSLDDLEKVFLRIGTRHRRRQNEDGATMLGDKGIGRLSAMRLGDTLLVKTTRAGEEHWNILEVDWSLFSHSEDVLVQDIEVSPTLGKRKDEREASGTTIRIGRLNADWSWERFNELLDGKIARFIDPFDAGLANKLVVAEHNGRRALIPSIPKPLMRHAHAVCRATFRFEAGEPQLEGTVNYREKRRATPIEARGSEVMTLSRTVRKRRAKRGHAAFSETPMSIDALRKLGGFDLELYWYNRRIVEGIENLTETKTASRDEIARWSGGPMLYRHGYRVLPFGDPTDDWLGLDKGAFGASGFKLNRQQLFGRIRIETPHRYLSEQTNREGLVQSEVSDALRRLVQWIIDEEFRNFINEVDDAERLQFRKEELANNQILRASNALKRAVGMLGQELKGACKGELEAVLRTAESLQEEAGAVLRRLEEVERQSIEDREKFVYLAGVGLMTEFVFHELERAVSHTMSLIAEVGATPASVSALKDQLQTLHKRVAAFDELTGEKRQRKSRFDLRQLVSDTVANHEREFARHGIELTLGLPGEAFTIRAVRGMVIQILENLVVNAAYWLKRQAEYEEEFEPQLGVTVNDTRQQLVVEDNGPGVPIARKERIFQPFVTTKPPGMGKGLGLYIARDMAEYHGWSLDVERDVGRIRPGRVNAFVLQMR